MHLTERIQAALAAHQRVTLPAGPVPAAVLLPLCEMNGAWHILFTKRTEQLNHHGGEISFPGGVRQGDDRTPLHAALRETWEEVGIPPEKVRVLGMLDDAYSVHNYLVTPYVGVFPGSWPLAPNPEEIARLIPIPLDHLRNPDIFRSELWTWQGQTHLVHFYQFEGDEVWGLTAGILKQFLDLVFPDERPEIRSETGDVRWKGQEGQCLTAS